MTIYTELATKQSGNKVITARKKQGKFSSVYEYEVIVSVDGMATDVIPAARTTWKKKFKETD